MLQKVRDVNFSFFENVYIKCVTGLLINIHSTVQIATGL